MDKDIDIEQNNEREDEMKEIKELGSVSVKNSKGTVKCMSIIGQIEGHTQLPPQSKSTRYEHIIPELISIEQDEDIDGLLIILNTIGGDVEAGLAIAEIISSMKKPTVSLVLGGSHSIGVPLAVAAKYSFIAPSASMTVHPIRMNGMVIGVSQMFHYFNRMQDRVVDFVTRNSGITIEGFTKLMLETDEIANDVGTILFGEQNVECGLIDAVGGLSEALDKLYELKENKS